MKKILYSILTLTLGLVLSSGSCTPQEAPEVPVISNLTVLSTPPTNVYFIFDIDKDASTVYSLVLLSTASAPLANAIKTGGGGTWIIPSAGTEYDWSYFPTLTPNTDYKLYLVAENAVGFSNVVSIAFKTNP